MQAFQFARPRQGRRILIAVFIVCALALLFAFDSLFPSKLGGRISISPLTSTKTTENAVPDAAGSESLNAQSATVGDSSNDANITTNANPVTEATSGHLVNYEVNLDLLRASFNDDSVEYTRWEINVVRSNKFSGFSNKLNLQPPSSCSISVKLNGSERSTTLPREHCASRVIIQAPISVKPDASHIIFGVATTWGRLNESLDAFAPWAAHTKTQIFAVLEPDLSIDKNSILQRAIDMGIRLTTTESKDEYLDRYYFLTRILLQHVDPSTKWAVLIDDDTFFPSMSRLVERLATYDASQSYYIGAPTESIHQMSTFSYFGYGGAGIFLSLPLLREIDQFYDKCFSIKVTGDARVAQCIYHHTTTKLTWDRRLFQMDLDSDASGFYGSGRPLPLSLHHWKSQDWCPVDVIAMNKVANICSDDCQLQRWHLGDNWYLVNGFSIVRYSAPLSDLDLISMEQTWDTSQWARETGYAFSLGPLREQDPGKLSFRLQHAVSDGPNRLRQLYTHQPGPEDDVARAVEVIWQVTSGGI